MARAIPTADRVHAFLMSGFAVATVAYWVDFFTTGNVKTSDDTAYIDHQQAFPLADAYMAGAFLLAARNLQRQRTCSTTSNTTSSLIGRPKWRSRLGSSPSHSSSVPSRCSACGGHVTA